MNSFEAASTLPAAKPDTMPKGRRRLLAWSVFGVQLVLFFASFYHYEVTMDEAWLAEQAYFLARDGYVHSNLLEGFVEHENRLVVYHYLFIRLGSLIIDLVGIDVLPLRLLSVVSGLVLLGVLAFFLHRSLRWSPEMVLLALTLFLLMPVNFRAMKLFRPEMLLQMFAFISYAALHRYRDVDSRGWLLLAGLAAGAATLSHLNGIILIGAGVLVLWWERRWHAGVGLAIGAAVALAPYLYEIVSHAALFREQFGNPVIAAKTHYTLLSPIIGVLNEHQRYLHDPTIIFTTIFAVLALWGNWRSDDTGQRFMRRYMLALAILLAVVVQDNGVRYASVLFPFFAIEMALALRKLYHWRRQTERWLRHALLIAAVAFAGYGLFYQLRNTFSEKEDLTALTREIGNQIPDGTRCLAPMNLVFNEVGRLQILWINLPALLEQPPHLVEVLAFANARRIDYIVQNSYSQPEERIADLDKRRDLLALEFETLVSTPKYAIFRRHAAASAPAPR